MTSISNTDTNVAKDDILKWFNIDNEITTLSSKIKKLRDEKNTLTKNIETFMENNNIGDIQTQGEKIKYCKSITAGRNDVENVQFKIDIKSAFVMILRPDLTKYKYSI